MGDQMSQAYYEQPNIAAPTPSSPMQDALRELDDALCELMKQQANLTIRLHPVLEPEGPNAIPSKDGAPTDTQYVLARIVKAIGIVNELTSHIERVRNRLVI